MSGITDAMPDDRGATRTTLPALLQRLVFAALMFVVACQHARVELAPALIAPGQRELLPVAQISGVKDGDRMRLKQSYYLWGLFPRERSYREADLCPDRGIREIHQFNTPDDLLIEQLTFGLYSPRTLEIRCY